MSLGNHLQGLLCDLRFAARSLRRSPGFAATTIVSLALGVALTGSTLSVMNSYMASVAVSLSVLLQIWSLSF